MISYGSLLRLGAWQLMMDRPYTPKEIARIAAGAVASLVIVGFIAVVAFAFMLAR